MDPNACLKEIRAILSEDRRIQPSDLSTEQVARLHELISGLDSWLSNGGFRPKDWNHD